jgi:hypothetical protein
VAYNQNGGFQKPKSNLVRVGGLWKGETKAGKKYMKGMKIKPEDLQVLQSAKEGSTFMLFVNDRKQPNETSKPDYELFLAPPSDVQPSPGQNQRPSAGPQQNRAPKNQYDDIPW